MRRAIPQGWTPIWRLVFGPKTSGKDLDNTPIKDDQPVRNYLQKIFFNGIAPYW
jgi:hypothetical protein